MGNIDNKELMGMLDRWLAQQSKVEEKMFLDTLLMGQSQIRLDDNDKWTWEVPVQEKISERVYLKKEKVVTPFLEAVYAANGKRLIQDMWGQWYYIKPDDK